MTWFEPCSLKIGDIFTTRSLNDENPFFICAKLVNGTNIASSRVCTQDKNQHKFASTNDFIVICNKKDSNAYQLVDLAQHKHQAIFYESKYEVRLNVHKIMLAINTYDYLIFVNRIYTHITPFVNH